MWPVLLDMTKEESMQCLRNLELEAYAHLVSALRAQGPLNPDKRKLLKDSSLVLNITQDRHKAEIRRAVNDEKLNTIAYHVTGLTESLEDWAQEGRRTVPLLPRMAPQTAYSAIADEVAENACQTNKQLPSPACTERKRTTSAQSVQLLNPETSKGLPFRIPENPKCEESKKRKLPICSESSSLVQHLLGPAKMSRTQQIYRQRTKAMMKEQTLKPKSQASKLPFSPHFQSSNGTKINASNPSISSVSNEETIEQIQNEINNYNIQKSSGASSPDTLLPSNLSEHIRTKLITPTKPSASLTFKQITSTPGTSSDQQKTLKICSSKKSVAKPMTSLNSQKLIVVSNAQTIQSSSILQKTLSIPLSKNLSLKNFEKFKIVTSSSPQIGGSNSISSIKHKVVTVKTNPTTKKVIPLSILNSKGGIKVLPIGGKIVGKTMTNATSSPLYIVNTVGTKNNVAAALQSHSVSNPERESGSPDKENGKSSVLSDIMKASGVTTDDLDSNQLGEVQKNNNNNNRDVEAREQVEEEHENEKEDYIVIQDDVSVVEPSADESVEICEVEQLTTPVVETEMIVQDSSLISVSEVDSN